jgi:hypothetical protein
MLRRVLSREIPIGGDFRRQNLTSNDANEINYFQIAWKCGEYNPQKVEAIMAKRRQRLTDLPRRTIETLQPGFEATADPCAEGVS